jgi:hypothetical protein
MKVTETTIREEPLKKTTALGVDKEDDEVIDMPMIEEDSD